MKVKLIAPPVPINMNVQVAGVGVMNCKECGNEVKGLTLNVSGSTVEVKCGDCSCTCECHEKRWYRPKKAYCINCIPFHPHEPDTRTL